MARSARLKNPQTPATARPAPSAGREVAYHDDVSGHHRILEALGAVPEFGPAAAGHVADEQDGRWSPLKTMFFVLVFCTTAWATISAAVILAFG